MIPRFILCYFYISAHCLLLSFLFSYIHDQNFARGSPIFFILFLVYARIRISTIEVTANTQQVLVILSQTGKPLRLHRPSRVTSCLTDFLYRTLWLISESRLASRAVYPRQNSKWYFWVNTKVLWILRQPMFTLSTLGVLRKLERRRRSIAARLRTS